MYVFNLVSLVLGERRFPTVLAMVINPRLYLQVIHHRAPQGSGVTAASTNKCLRRLYNQAKYNLQYDAKNLIPTSAAATYCWQKQQESGEISFPRCCEVETRFVLRHMVS